MSFDLNPFASPTFIGGLQRSGTTLLSRLIAGHPDVTGLAHTHTDEDEGQFVQDVYLDDHEMGAKRGVHGGASMRWAYHPKAHLVEEDAHTSNDAALRLKTSWSPYLEKRDAPFFIEKSPSNLMRIRFLQEIFPDAKFIIITRNPIVQALAVRKWGTWRMRAGLDLDASIDHWLTAMECFQSDMSMVKSVAVYSYEDLVANPSAILSSVQEFMGIREHSWAITGVSDQSERYRAYWERMRTDEPGRFVPLNGGPQIRSKAFRILERAVVPIVGKRDSREIEQKYGERIGRFGYSVSDLEFSGSWV